MEREEALKEAKKNMRFKVSDIKKVLTNDLKYMQKAKTFEEFMKAKQALMLNFVSSPTGTAYCPYCLQNDFPERIYDTACQHCEYGKKHGMCLENGSDYKLLMKAFDELEKQIGKYW